MAIRIRVYPQPNSVGARRNRARRQKQQQLTRLRQQQARQQHMLHRQSMQAVPFAVPTAFHGMTQLGMGNLAATPSMFGQSPAQSYWGASFMAQPSTAATWGVPQTSWNHSSMAQPFAWGHHGPAQSTSWW